MPFIEFHTSFEDTSMVEWKLREREKRMMWNLYIELMNKFTMLCSLYSENRDGKAELKQKSNCLTNPNCTRGIRGNKLINLYIQNDNRLWLSKLSYCSLALYLQNYNALYYKHWYLHPITNSILPLKMNHRCWLGSSWIEGSRIACIQGLWWRSQRSGV